MAGVIGRVEPNSKLTSFGLKIGEIIQVIYPDDKSSLTKRFMEYDVHVFERGGYRKFTNCLLINTFGGNADAMQFTLRKDVGNGRTAGLGSKVLVMSIDGHTDRTVILGGVRDPLAKDDNIAKASKDDGHHFVFEFNGIRAEINDSGRFRIRFKGPTDINGKAIDSQAHPPGAVFEFSDNGDIIVQSDDLNRFKYDYANKTWRTESERMVELNVDDGLNTIQLTKNLGIKMVSKGNSQFFGEIYSETTGRIIEVAEDGVFVGGDPDVSKSHNMIRGSTYRFAEIEMHNKIMATLVRAISSVSLIQGQLTAAGLTLTVAGGVMIVPIVGAMIAGPLVITSGSSIVGASSALAFVNLALQSIIDSITSFNTQPARYLSEKAHVI